MALVTTEKMLKDAQAGHYAVGAFNVENLEFVMAVLAAAEETKSPVIMQTTPGTIKTAGLDYFYGMVKAAAERASVPVALHLDHGDGYDRCMQAFRTGYTSVMIDGSHESFEDNIALTKSVADAGRAMGVPVEASSARLAARRTTVPRLRAEPLHRSCRGQGVRRAYRLHLPRNWRWHQPRCVHERSAHRAVRGQGYPRRRRRAAGSARHLRCAR